MDIRYCYGKNLQCIIVDVKCIPNVGDFVELFNVIYIVEQRKFDVDGKTVDIAIRKKTDNDYYSFKEKGEEN